jgi:hypothetical protein
MRRWWVIGRSSYRTERDAPYGTKGGKGYRARVRVEGYRTLRRGDYRTIR